VGLPIVSFRGTKTRADIAGLTPNRLYHFKLRYSGSRSNSELSDPLVLMTAPLPPSAPVIIELSSNTVRIKWYPPEFGAFKFVVHLKQIVVSASEKFSGTLNKNRKGGTTSIVGPDAGDGWVSVYNGQENNYVNTVLASDSTYLVRVLAVNCQGVCSEPSQIVNFATLERSDSSEQLTSRNAGATFTVECTGDICVGDTILLTERLFAKTTINKPEATSTRDALNASMTGSVRGSTVGLRSQTRPPSGSIRGQPGLLSSNNPLNMSVTSLNADGVTISAAPGAFVGERTIAAYVSKDNYRTIRDILSEQGVQPQDSKRVGKLRKLWLEVVWQRSSSEACKPFEVRPGEVLERQVGHLEQFEVFRVKWKQEEARTSFRDEYNSLVDCYIQTDC
jgi:hypothetical protein